MTKPLARTEIDGHLGRLGLTRAEGRAETAPRADAEVDTTLARRALALLNNCHSLRSYLSIDVSSCRVLPPPWGEAHRCGEHALRIIQLIASHSPVFYKVAVR